RLQGDWSSDVCSSDLRDPSWALPDRGVEFHRTPADWPNMALRVAAHLPRLVVLLAVFLLAGATLTYGAAKRLSAPSGKPVPAARSEERRVGKDRRARW